MWESHTRHVRKNEQFYGGNVCEYVWRIESQTITLFVYIERKSNFLLVLFGGRFCSIFDSSFVEFALLPHNLLQIVVIILLPWIISKKFIAPLVISPSSIGRYPLPLHVLAHVSALKKIG